MPRAMKSLINTAELGRAIRRRREELELSLRDVADQTSVSASTLSRIENGTGKPDADNIARLTTWLDVPLERILGGGGQDHTEAKAVVYFPHESTPEIVEAHLRADKNLTRARRNNRPNRFSDDKSARSIFAMTISAFLSSFRSNKSSIC